MKTYRLLLFDRDGTLTYENTDFHKDLSTLSPYPFTAITLQRLHRAGFLMAVITNQSGIARGYWSMGQVETLHQQLTKEWRIPLQFYVCPHHPNDDCFCRKPRTGLIERAMVDFNLKPAQCLMIGDTITDYESARAAGIDFGLVLTGRGRATEGRLQGAPILKTDTVAQIGSALG